MATKGQRTKGGAKWKCTKCTVTYIEAPSVPADEVWHRCSKAPRFRLTPFKLEVAN